MTHPESKKAQNTPASIDALHTERYDELVRQILDSKQAQPHDPIRGILRAAERSGIQAPELLKQELDDLLELLNSEPFVLRPEIAYFASGLEMIYDEKEECFNIINIDGVDELDLGKLNINRISLPSILKIRKLSLRGNNLISMPMSLPVDLEELDLGGNEFEFFNGYLLPPKLKSLKLDTNLDLKDAYGPLPDSLESLSLSGTGIKRWGIVPPKLKKLNVSGTPIERIDSLSNLVELDCSYAQKLPALPELPDTLLKLDIQGCPDLVIEELPKNLKELYCGSCGYTELPFAIPPSVELLACDKNKLTELPYFPNPKVYVSISGNPLSEAALTQINSDDDSVYVL